MSDEDEDEDEPSLKKSNPPSISDTAGDDAPSNGVSEGKLPLRKEEKPALSLLSDPISLLGQASNGPIAKCEVDS